MSNNLLQGLVEYWQPDVALGSLKGMVAGIDFETSADISVVADIRFPGGFALSSTVANAEIETGPNPLLADWGTVDFLACFYAVLPIPASNVQTYYYIGEANSDGFETYCPLYAFPNPNSGVISFDVPGSDRSFPSVSTPLNTFTPNQLNCVILWWTAVTKILNLQMNGGTVYSSVSAVPTPGTPDFTNYAAYSPTAGNGDVVLGGPFSVWRGTIPDSTQRSLLFGGLPFSQWDSGGSGGNAGITYDTHTGRRSGMGDNPHTVLIGAYKRGGYARR